MHWELHKYCVIVCACAKVLTVFGQWSMVCAVNGLWCLDVISCILAACLLCLSGRSPEADGSCVCVCVCVCFCRKLSRARSPRPLKIKRWNMQCKLNAILSWNKIGEFWIGALLWSDCVIYIWLLTLTAVFFCCPESVEEQPSYNRLLFNLVVPSLLQGRQRAKLNQDNPGRQR